MHELVPPEAASVKIPDVYLQEPSCPCGANLWALAWVEALEAAAGDALVEGARSVLVSKCDAKDHLR